MKIGAWLLLAGLLVTRAGANDLTYTLGPKGLASLAYRGNSLLAGESSGALQIAHQTPTAVRFDAGTNTLTQT